MGDLDEFAVVGGGDEVGEVTLGLLDVDLHGFSLVLVEVEWWDNLYRSPTQHGETAMGGAPGGKS